MNRRWVFQQYLPITVGVIAAVRATVGIVVVIIILVVVAAVFLAFAPVDVVLASSVFVAGVTFVVAVVVVASSLS